MDRDPNRYYKRTIHRHTIASSFLQEERRLIVYLPPGYNELTGYPAVYCQDGEQFFNFGRIATWANKLILDENADPFLIVGVEVNSQTRNADYHPEGARFEAFCRFFTQEVLPFIERTYPSRQDPDERILAGDSLAAAVSLHLALNEPKLFHKVLSLSGAFYTPTAQAIERQPDLSWLKLYMVVGLQETAVETNHGTFDFLRLNREARSLLQEKHAQLTYRERPGTHIWGFWQKELGEGLSHFFQ
jgi:enterochelin esterase-like enzyme